MNPKIILSFLAGAALASGIVYYAARPEPITKAILVSSIDQPAPERKVELGDDSPAPVGDTARFARTKAAKRQQDRDSATYAKESPMLSFRQEKQDVANREMAQSQPAPVPSPAPVSQPPVPKQPDVPPASASAPEPPHEEAASSTAPAAPHSVTLIAGTALSVRVGETLSTKKSQAGDTFLATLSQPLVIDGFVIAERGARAEGRIVEVDKAGKVKGNPLLVVELTRFTSSDGQNVKVRTSAYNQEGKSPTPKNAAKVAGGAALGAIIGAVAGGGKGAGIGAGVGGAAGAGDVALTKGPDAEIAVETRLTFRVQEPVTITERLR